jgi:formylglycine-generating enzyme required for sulfatase activity
VVRGGSYINNDRNVRCAYRNRNTLDNINDNQGFRVVLLRSRSSNDDG